MRMLEDTPAHSFKRLLGTDDRVTSTESRGLCCSLFKSHLEVISILLFLRILVFLFILTLSILSFFRNHGLGIFSRNDLYIKLKK